MTLARLANLVVLLPLALLLPGVINRVKALWSGRKGPPLLQLAFDVWRLLRKTSVYSTTTTPLFVVGPYVLLVTSLGSAMIVPLLGGPALVSFPFDFVFFAYLWALGRMASVLAALDTGSAFEGMGAAREATFSTVLEPAIFLVMGALCAMTHTNTLQGALSLQAQSGATLLALVCAVVTLSIALQVEAARMPVDDPSTHLELTMVHEVMALDHSGPELAVIHLASAIKLLVGTSLIATLCNPWANQASFLTAFANVALCLLVAVLLGTLESLIARLRLRAVPQYIVVALASGAVALLATAWRVGASP